MTPQERKASIKLLYKEHADYFKDNKIEKPAYIPKMAYRPAGKDDLHVTFFPSELENNMDIYTEFVSIEYKSEDPKRTLYLLKYNPHWKEEYEMITSNSGFQRHMVPVSELKAINDVTHRGQRKLDNEDVAVASGTFDALPNPETERDIVDVLKGIEKALLSINSKLK
tara:strand:+ start:1647 stop:2150 length:504 start_codon:yes stop_codon:yes gene_type:complete